MAVSKGHCRARRKAVFATSRQRDFQAVDGHSGRPGGAAKSRGVPCDPLLPCRTKSWAKRNNSRFVTTPLRMRQAVRSADGWSAPLLLLDDSLLISSLGGVGTALGLCVDACVCVLAKPWRGMIIILHWKPHDAVRVPGSNIVMPRGFTCPRTHTEYCHTLLEEGRDQCTRLAATAAVGGAPARPMRRSR